MAETKIVFYRDKGWVPVLEWMTELRMRDRKAYSNGLARLKLLREQGWMLRRPAAAPLAHGLHELRWKQGHVQYRILYFFHGQNFVVLAHAMVKEGQQVREEEIKRALERKVQYELDPAVHTFDKEVEDG